MLRPGAEEILAGPVEFQFEVTARTPPVARIDVYAGRRLVGAATAPQWSLGWEAPTAGRAVSVLAVAYDGDGNLVTRIEHISPGVGPAFSETVTVASVQLYPVVIDSLGRYVTGLERGDFAIYEEGRRVPLEYFGRQTGELTLALLLDVSGSMSEDLSAVQTAAAELVSRLEPDNGVAVFGFNHLVVQAVATPTVNRAAVRSAIQSLAAGGGTALFDALYRVLERLQGVAGRKAIVLFSDGMDQRSVTPLATAIELARDSEVLIYAIGTRRSDPKGRSREDLRRLAEETGGQFFLLDKFKRLAGILTDVLHDLRSQYILAFRPTPGTQPEIRSIRVEVPARRVRIRHRERYAYRPEG